MAHDKIGRIVWHDLFTQDRPQSMQFYEKVASWTFVTEHATDFAWGGGEKDFVLAIAHGEVGAGFAETPQDHADGWIPYVEVEDVDRSAARVEKLGGTVAKQPFDVPGVGRNCLLRDPLGATFGICQSRHPYPVQKRQFGGETYLSAKGDFPDEFYADVLGWTATGGDRSCEERMIALSSGDCIAKCVYAQWHRSDAARWVPSILVADVKAAGRVVGQLGGQRFDTAKGASGQRNAPVFCDPNGAFFRLSQRNS